MKNQALYVIFTVYSTSAFDNSNSLTCNKELNWTTKKKRENFPMAYTGPKLHPRFEV